MGIQVQNSKMSRVFLICFTLLVIVVAEQSQASVDNDHNQPRYAKLIKLSCGWDQILWCAEEVGEAWLGCYMFPNPVTCISEVLGASDCVACVCDVLDYLGLMTC